MWLDLSLTHDTTEHDALRQRDRHRHFTSTTGEGKCWSGQHTGWERRGVCPLGHPRAAWNRRNEMAQRSLCRTRQPRYAEASAKLVIVTSVGEG